MALKISTYTITHPKLQYIHNMEFDVMRESKLIIPSFDVSYGSIQRSLNFALQYDALMTYYDFE